MQSRPKRGGGQRLVGAVGGGCGLPPLTAASTRPIAPMSDGWAHPSIMLVIPLAPPTRLTTMVLTLSVI